MESWKVELKLTEESSSVRMHEKKQRVGAPEAARWRQRGNDHRRSALAQKA